MKVCKEEFCYVYEADISPICSVPTVCDLNRKFQRYSDQLEKINDELTEKKKVWTFLLQKNHRRQLVWIRVLKQVKKVLPGKTFWTLAVRTSAHVTVAPTLNSLSTHLTSQFRISSNLLGIQPLFKECPELISIPVKIRSN